ncbi:DUF4129 domain-containing protein [Streptomyces sp. YC504]|uniref:DUF4129 domain-containing protein n=2 Tax=Streptomyces mesophilus TaxID=1775132 RepID=A0A6G4XQE9_9ACTN|nr:DUF4129 domain-containing protein [Streptomyces mesophilus]
MMTTWRPGVVDVPPIPLDGLAEPAPSPAAGAAPGAPADKTQLLKSSEVARVLGATNAADATQILSTVDPADATQVLGTVDPADATQVLGTVDPADATQVLGTVDPADATQALPAADRTMVLGALGSGGRNERPTQFLGTVVGPHGETLAAPPADASYAVSPVQGKRLRSWKRPALAAVVVFGVTMGGITVYEAVAGENLAGTGNGSTLRGVFTGGGGGGGGTISAVNPLVSLQNSLNQPNDREVLRYRTNSESNQDMYLRIVSLDQFDGTAWKPAERAITEVPSPFPQPRGLSGDVDAKEVTTEITAADDYAQDWLPMPYPATAVDIDGNWRFEPIGRAVVGDRGETTKGKDYRVGSLVVRPTAAKLAGAPAPNADIEDEFTDVPDSLPRDVSDTALKVTEGATNQYEMAVKLQDWFAVSGGFSYDTKVTAGSGSAAISRFLKDKQGFCVHFSFAMASMARTLGIPSRVAVGFTPGSPTSDGAMSVGLRDAHAWPELYFEGVGWTRFEPTPTRGTAPDYTREETPSDSPTTAAPSSSSSTAPSGEDSPSPSDSCPADLRRFGECGSQEPGAAGSGSGGGTPWGTYLGISAAVLLLIGVPLLPLMWRTRVRGIRLGSGGRTPADGAARTLAAWLEVTDTAWDYGIAPDEAQTPRKAAARIVRLGELEIDAAEAVHRLAAAVEQVLYAPTPRPAPGVAEDVRTVRAGLRATMSRGTRLRATFAPRSAVRVGWAFSDRWSALKERWGGGRWSFERLVPRRAK